MSSRTALLALESSGLTKTYGRRTALADCDLAIPHGAVVGLVGPNGAGKSTLLQLTCGLIRPTAGTLRVVGAPPGSGADHLAKVGFVAQDAPVYPALTVREHLVLGARLNPGWDADLARRRVTEVGLDHDQKAGSLSGGQRAQLALAMAVAKRPELLVLDEPPAALDPLARQAFMESLNRFAAEIGATTVLSSHLLEDVERFCDFLVVLSGGRVRAHGPTAHLVATHRRLAGDRDVATDSDAFTVVGAVPTGVVVRINHPQAEGTRPAAGPPGGPVAASEVAFAYLAAAETTGGGAR